MTFKRIKSRKSILLGLCLALVSCGPEALPRHAPAEKDLSDSLTRAEKAANEARLAEQGAAAKLEESKKQLELAHQYLKRAEAAANLCKGNFSRVQANEAARKKAELLAKKRAAAVAAARKKEEELRLRAEEEAKALAEANPPPKKEPEFSKSDAP